jgi:RNA polymerase sigma factor (sigma-70 family)
VQRVVGLKAEAAAGRKRAAVELIARDGDQLRRTAMRFSLCVEDAEDAYQRALEILLLKAPSDRPRELARWMQTVVKHEALAVRANRRRLLGDPPPSADGFDPIAQIAAPGDEPDVRAERDEQVARSREALRSLKPAERRALALLAAGYSYAEIGEITGFSQTKVNRCLAEGRGRFRAIVAGSEDGTRCAGLAPLLSAFCDGEAAAGDADTVREHLRACASCRATMRAYRATPAAVAALAPALPLSRSLLERGQDLLNGLYARIPGGGGVAESGAGQVAVAGGTRGAGAAALAKLLAICAGTVGGAAACVAGVVPAPLDLTTEHARAPKIERVSRQVRDRGAAATVEYRPSPGPAARAQPERSGPRDRSPAPAAAPAPTEADVGSATEYAPPPPVPAPPEAPGAPSSSGSSGSAAGEFGP